MRLRLVVVTGVLLASPLFLAGRGAAANPQTAGLQVALRAYGLYTGPIDAIAGPGTVTATREFQRRHGLRADGLPGARTRAAKRWQRHLGLASDGIAGPQTLAVLARRNSVPLAKPRKPVVVGSPTGVRASLERWATHYRIDPRLVKALAWMESGYNPNLTSKTGAWGVMQIQPTTWDFAENVLLGRQVPHTA